MITQEIFDYMAKSGEGQSDYAAVMGLLISQGVFVQFLSDGMVLFHDPKEKVPIRVLLHHMDSIHDIILTNADDCKLNMVTCSKDNSIRLWQTMQESNRPVENELKRVVYLEHEE